MKHDIYYTLRRQSPWVTVSGALMGIPFLIQAIYYLLVRSIVEVHIAELAIFMIAPMAIELFWCLTIHVFRLRTTVTLGVSACLVFLMLIAYSLFYSNMVRTIIDIVSFLILSQLLVLILFGRFPYRLFGSVGLLAALVCRVLFFTYPVYIHAAQWEELLTRELPGVCMLASMYCVLGAMEPHKKEEKKSTGIQ
jgi:drug/metabolite transporter (DMT)-like permease